MTALVTERFYKLAGTLAELKMKVSAALATELATAVGTAVRDVLVVAMLDRLVVTPARTATRAPISEPGGWAEGDDHDRWDSSRASGSDYYDTHYERTSTRYEREEDEERAEVEPTPAVSAVTAVAVGVTLGRWWLARKGGLLTAIGAGVLATAVGLAGGPIARAALAVLAAATDVLTAETALARLDLS